MSKIATSLEQSRKLSEFLSGESSDMHYAFMGIGGAAFQDILDKTAILLPGNKNNKYPYEPAWSLTSLYELLPNKIEHDFKTYFFKMETDIYDDGIKYYSLGYQSGGGNGWLCYEDDVDLVDCCVKIMLKLKELELI